MMPGYIGSVYHDIADTCASSSSGMKRPRCSGSCVKQPLCSQSGHALEEYSRVYGQIRLITLMINITQLRSAKFQTRRPCHLRRKSRQTKSLAIYTLTELSQSANFLSQLSDHLGYRLPLLPQKSQLVFHRHPMYARRPCIPCM